MRDVPSLSYAKIMTHIILNCKYRSELTQLECNKLVTELKNDCLSGCLFYFSKLSNIPRNMEFSYSLLKATIRYF